MKKNFFSLMVPCRWLLLCQNNWRTSRIREAVSQDSVLRSTLYSQNITDIPFTDHVLNGTYADETIILAASDSPIQAKGLAQIMTKTGKLSSIALIFNRSTLSIIIMHNMEIPLESRVKYRRAHLDPKIHILMKKKKLKINSRNIIRIKLWRWNYDKK